MRLGAVSYINALPFVVPLQKQHDVVLAPPSTLNQHLRSSLLDAALCSSIVACDPKLHTLLDFGIASKGPVLSVHLYSPCPPLQLTGRRIALDPSSETSVALLKILCHHHWRVEVEFVRQDQPHNAWLKIGDKALACQHHPGYLTIDLASAWYEMTSLPFVFALFVTSMTPSAELTQKLNDALIWSTQNQQEILERAEQQTALPRELILTYFNQITYRLGSHEKRGFETFRQLCCL